MDTETKITKNNYIDQLLNYPKNYILQFDLKVMSFDNVNIRNILHITSNKTDMDRTNNANPRNPAIFLKNNQFYISIYAGNNSTYENVILDNFPNNGLELNVSYSISFIVSNNNVKLIITNKNTKVSNTKIITNNLLSTNTDMNTYLYIASPWYEPCDAFISNVKFMFVNTYTNVNVPVDNLDTVTNKLLLKYDDKFNQLYDSKLNIDESIINKEEILIQLNNEIEIKENQIKTLNIIAMTVFLICIIFILYVNKQIDFVKSLGLSIFIVVVAFIILYMTILNKVQKKIMKTAEQIGKGMKNYIQEQIPDWKCPSKCSLNIQEEESKTPPPDIIRVQGGVSATLRTNPQSNVWKYGDTPVDLYTSEEGPPYPDMDIPNYANPNNSPQPSFRGLKDNYLTYYQCSWMGGDNVNDTLPSGKNRENTFSSIPCSYRPNYKELGKYICNKNPNNDFSSDGTIPKYCINVSHY